MRKYWKDGQEIALDDFKILMLKMQLILKVKRQKHRQKIKTIKIMIFGVCLKMTMEKIKKNNLSKILDYG